MKRKIFLVLSILWMCVIFYMSNQPAAISSAHSGGVINMISNMPVVGTLMKYLMSINIG